MDSVGRRKFLQALGAAAAGLAPFHSAWALDDSINRVLNGASGPLAAAATRSNPRPAPRKAPRKLFTVVVDAGHGGVDPGCIGRTGTYEKDIVLDTALRFARGLEASKRYKVSMSRRTDDFVTLEGRVARARAINADLFISVHADALRARRLGLHALGKSLRQGSGDGRGAREQIRSCRRRQIHRRSAGQRNPLRSRAPP